MTSKLVLNDYQRAFLDEFSKNKILKASFYLTGGTALCEFYIPYRLSEDLDFFSEEEFELTQITTYLRTIKNNLGYNMIDINTSFNRNIFQLIFAKEVLKLEFTYFPFPQIEKPKEKEGIKVDSLMDIAVNKLFSIYQKPRARDYMDIYMIHKNFGVDLKELIEKAKVKFDWHVDPLKLGSQFLLAREVKDYPRLIKKVKQDDWQTYFENQAKRLEKDIFNK